MNCYWDLYVFFLCDMDDMMDGGSVALWHQCVSLSFFFPYRDGFWDLGSCDLG